jgi:hypothetical protein
MFQLRMAIMTRKPEHKIKKSRMVPMVRIQYIEPRQTHTYIVT